MNQTQVLDWTPVVETAFPEYLRPEDTDIMRARLLLAFIWRQINIGDLDPPPSWILESSHRVYQRRIRCWERVFRDDGLLMMLIRESENNTNLFLSRVRSCVSSPFSNARQF